MLCLYVCMGDFVSNDLFEIFLFLQVHLMALPSAFGVKFHKCAEVRRQRTHFFLVSPLNSKNRSFDFIGISDLNI